MTNLVCLEESTPHSDAQKLIEICFAL